MATTRSRTSASPTLRDSNRANGAVMIPPTVPILLAPDALMDRLFAILGDTTVIVAPVSKAKVPLRTPLNVTGTRTEVPFITTGTVTVFAGKPPSRGDGTIFDSGNEGSAGRDLKNLSSCFDSSLSPGLTHPTLPFLALTKYQRAPWPTKVSANGEILSPGLRITITSEDSSGTVNSCVSPRAVREGGSVAANGCLQTAERTKAIKIRASGFVEGASDEFSLARNVRHQLERARTFRFFYTVSVSISRALQQLSPYSRWFDAGLPR
jgi:hypothetical protein